jgi:hypothetical protein
MSITRTATRREWIATALLAVAVLRGAQTSAEQHVDRAVPALAER